VSAKKISTHNHVVLDHASTAPISVGIKCLATNKTASPSWDIKQFKNILKRFHGFGSVFLSFVCCVVFENVVLC
jgi:hypothetical protein